MAAYFEDEFEEFRARALSGGSLPSITQLLERTPGASTSASGGSASGSSDDYNASMVAGVHSLTLSPSPSHRSVSCTSPSSSPGRRAGQSHAFPGSTSTSQCADHAFSMSQLPDDLCGACSKTGVPTVVLDDILSDAETESTLISESEKGEGDRAGGGDNGGGVGAHGGSSSPGRPLLTSPRQVMHRHSADASTDRRPQPETKTSSATPGHGERVLSHMSWVVLDDDEWHLGDMRPRISSMPAQSLQRSHFHHPRGTSPLAQGGKSDRGSPATQHRVRSFAITPKGVVSKGAVVVAGSSSNSVASNDSESTTQSNTSGELPSYRVMVSGEAGVGKRALVQSFRCTDADAVSTASFDDDDDADHTVSILLDGEESTLEFIDFTKQEVSGALAEGDCYIVVYSVEWRHSFEVAVEQLRDVRENIVHPVAIILVANKADLVRSRVVGEQEGRSAAKKYDCKYIEVSAAIDHRVDDLLVGILKQIRLTKQKADKLAKSRGHRGIMHKPEEACCHILRAQQNMLSKLFRGQVTASKSCENLYEL